MNRMVQEWYDLFDAKKYSLYNLLYIFLISQQRFGLYIHWRLKAEVLTRNINNILQNEANRYLLHYNKPQNTEARFKVPPMIR